MKAARDFLVVPQTIKAIVAVVGAVGVTVTIINFVRFLETVPIPGHLPFP